MEGWKSMQLGKNKSIIIKVVLLCAMLMMLGIGNGYANHHEEKCQCEHKQCLTHKHSFMKTHINMYYELLAEKYAPDQVKVWQEIVKERALIKKKISNAKKNGGKLDEKDLMKEWFKEHKEIQAKFEEAIEKRDNKEITNYLPVIFEQHQKLNDLLKEALKGME